MTLTKISLFYQGAFYYSLVLYTNAESCVPSELVEELQISSTAGPEHTAIITHQLKILPV